MYESYFGLTERPFSIAPDPDYLYMSSRHKEAMAHLSYGLSQGGCFIVLTGEVGTGKTTLCRNLLSDLPNNVDVALILNAYLGSTELLQTICDELKVDYAQKATQKQLLDRINAHLLKTFSENRHTVLIIDEAQLLKRNVLEQIRLLTNLETTKSKLLQIILIGQPELYNLLSRNDLRQLAQRVTARYHLGALERSEIEEYVNCRLTVAGCKQPLFSRQALNKMHALTGGIPRKINVLADQALLATYSQNKTLVDAKTVAKTAREVFIVTRPPSAKSKSRKSRKKTSSISPWHWLVLACLIVGLNLLFWWYQSNPAVDQQAVTQKNDTHAEVLLSESVVSPIASPSADSTSVEPKNVNDETRLETASLIDSALSVQTTELALDSQSTIDTAPLIDTQPLDFDESTSLGLLLDASADVTGRITVLRRLASLWGAQLPNKLINSVCNSIDLHQLRCLSVKQWSNLEVYNRPAVVLLEHKGRKHRVIVRSIEQGTATLLIGAETQEVSISEIEQRWAGEGLIFWRPSLSGAPLLKQGDEDDRVVLMRLQLAEVLRGTELGSLAELDSVVFDQKMSETVALLQTSYELSGDGFIGNETYLLINELMNPDVTPVLRQRNEVSLN